MVSHNRKTAICVKCQKHKEIKAFGECIACYNARRRTKKKFEWSYSHPFCVICKTTKNSHHAKGICCKCRNTHDAVYIKLQLQRNVKRTYTEEDLEIRRQKKRKFSSGKKELYDATRRGLNGMGGSDKQIRGDIKLLQKEINKILKKIKWD